PRYDDVAGSVTVTTAPLPAQPTGAQIAEALKAAVAALPDSGISGAGRLVLDVHADGTLENSGDYVFNTDLGLGPNVLVIWATDGTLDLPDLTTAIFKATSNGAPGLFPNYTVTDAGAGVAVITAKEPGNINPDLDAGSFGGTYTGTATPSVTTQGAG